MPDDAQPGGPDADLIALAEDLRRAVGGFVRKVRNAAGTPSAASAETLGELDRHGAMSVAALARKRRVRHQSMRLVVAQLEAETLVRRVPDPDDGRSQLVDISAAGRAALSALRAARARWIAASLRTGTTVRERAALRTAIAVLDRLAAPD